MKEAKTEAEKVVANYRAEMEVNYQVSLAKVTRFLCMFHVAQLR